MTKARIKSVLMGASLLFAMPLTLAPAEALPKMDIRSANAEST